MLPINPAKLVNNFIKTHSNSNHIQPYVLGLIGLFSLGVMFTGLTLHLPGAITPCSFVTFVVSVILCITLYKKPKPSILKAVFHENFIKYLPEELLLEIFKYLSLEDKGARLVCRQWYRLLKDPCLKYGFLTYLPQISFISDLWCDLSNTPYHFFSRTSGHLYYLSGHIHSRSGFYIVADKRESQGIPSLELPETSGYFPAPCCVYQDLIVSCDHSRTKISFFPFQYTLSYFNDPSFKLIAPSQETPTPILISQKVSCMNGDGHVLVTGLIDGTIGIWKRTSENFELIHSEPVTELPLSFISYEDSGYIAGATKEGVIDIWKLEPDEDGYTLFNIAHFDLAEPIHSIEVFGSYLFCGVGNRIAVYEKSKKIHEHRLEDDEVAFALRMRGTTLKVATSKKIIALHFAAQTKVASSKLFKRLLL